MVLESILGPRLKKVLQMRLGTGEKDDHTCRPFTSLQKVKPEAKNGSGPQDDLSIFKHSRAELDR